ncbi:MAG: FAD-dependent tricarballylate dehydrogenase TcuA [Alphaproteobacteria bacterium]
MSELDYDVIVVGAGNAALAAATAASQAGAKRVVVLEKAPEHMRGGNTHYSGGLFRIAFDEAEDLRPLVPDAEDEVPGFFDNVTPYPQSRFWEDLLRVTDGRTDRELGEILIGRSYDAIRWMHECGIEMEPATALSGVKVGNRVTFPSGAVIRAVHEGVGLSARWFDIVEQRGIEVRYRTAARGLLQEISGRVVGVAIKGPGGFAELRARAVVLACGGFEANQAWRARYLGSPWDHAKVRGTPHNTGDGLKMALDIGALAYGQWTGCHSTPIDAEAPSHGDRELTDKTNRLSYPFGVLVNRRGKRFLDEGEDFQLYTYAKTGGAILREPGGVAYQIFDAKTSHLLEPRYVTATPVEADSLEALVARLPLDQEACLETLRAYNAAAGAGTFDPSVKDGIHTQGVSPAKSNWALPLDSPPYVAYSSTGGITFTFGGLKVDEGARVFDNAQEPIAGLFACGELVGGLFHHNYPGGSGLVSGAVFGRIAGAGAAGA